MTLAASRVQSNRQVSYKMGGGVIYSYLLPLPSFIPPTSHNHSLHKHIKVRVYSEFYGATQTITLVPGRIGAKGHRSGWEGVCLVFYYPVFVTPGERVWVSPWG